MTTLDSWVLLNEAVMATRSIEKLTELLNEEAALPNPRRTYLRRIYSRLNRVRIEDEREALEKMWDTRRT